MCRNIRPLFNFEPPATEAEIRDASLQFVRKLSGFHRPSKANEAAFDRGGGRDRGRREAARRLARDDGRTSQSRHGSGQGEGAVGPAFSSHRRVRRSLRQRMRSLRPDPMQIFANPHHALHAARHEMFRGKLVPVNEVPARMDVVLAELARRPVGQLQSPPPVTQAQLERVHARRYLDFLRTAWSEWVALDRSNAEFDALPSVWPVRGFRADVEPANFAARMGLYSFDAGTPLMAGTLDRRGSGCRLRRRGRESVARTGGTSRNDGAHATPGSPRRPRFFRRLLLPQQRRDRGAVAARRRRTSRGRARRRLPPRQRHAEPFLRARRRADRVDPRRPAHRVPVLPRPRRRAR